MPITVACVQNQQPLDHVRDADLVVLPELWDVGYFAFDRYRASAAKLDEKLAPLRALKLRSTIVAGSVLERSADGIHNTTAVLGPDGDLLGTYRKSHLFGRDSHEAALLTPGDGPVVVDTPAGRIGLAICFDLRFPEHFALDADVFAVVAAWPAARAEHWRLLVRARAIERQTPVIGCCAAGSCEGVELAGRSAIVDATGAVLAEAGTEPCVLEATIDHAATAAWRQEFPMRGARPRRRRPR